MNETPWIILAYGIVTLVLVTYTVRLRRRLRKFEGSKRPPRVSASSIQ